MLVLRNIAVTALVLGAAAIIAPSAMAQSMILNKDSRDSYISGTVGSVGYDYMDLIVDEDTTIRVDLDDMDIEFNDFDEFFAEGTQVQVVGRFDSDGDLEAERVMKLPAGTNFYLQPDLN
jgi:hypothetical protein